MADFYDYDCIIGTNIKQYKKEILYFSYLKREKTPRNLRTAQARGVIWKNGV